MLRSSLDGILGEVDEYLAQHVGVGVDEGFVSDRIIPCHIGVELLYVADNAGEHDSLDVGLL